MTKTDDERLLGRKMYFNSRNLNKPKEIKESSVVEALVGSLQKTLLLIWIHLKMNTIQLTISSISYKNNYI